MALRSKATYLFKVDDKAWTVDLKSGNGASAAFCCATKRRLRIDCPSQELLHTGVFPSLALFNPFSLDTDSGAALEASMAVTVAFLNLLIAAIVIVAFLNLHIAAKLTSSSSMRKARSLPFWMAM